jgi:hypothetical protein
MQGFASVSELSTPTIGRAERAAIRGFVAYCMRDATDNVVIVGPAGCRDDMPGRYFMVATSNSGFRCNCMSAGNGIDVDEMRTAARAELLTRRSVVVIDMDDELEMARLCERRWPGEKVTALRKSVA